MCVDNHVIILYSEIILPGEYGLVLCSSTRMEDVPAATTFTVEDMLSVHTMTIFFISFFKHWNESVVVMLWYDTIDDIFVRWTYAYWSHSSLTATAMKAYLLIVLSNFESSDLDTF